MTTEFLKQVYKQLSNTFDITETREMSEWCSGLEPALHADGPDLNLSCAI